MAISTLQKGIKQGQKAMKNKILHELSLMVDRTRQGNRMSLHHGYAKKIIAETHAVFPHLNYDKLTNYNRAQIKQARKQANRCVLM